MLGGASQQVAVDPRSNITVGAVENATVGAEVATVGAEDVTDSAVKVAKDQGSPSTSDRFSINTTFTLVTSSICSPCSRSRPILGQTFPGSIAQFTRSISLDSAMAGNRSAVASQRVVMLRYSGPGSLPRNTEPPRYQLDRNKQAAYSEFIRRSGTTLANFIRILRGESPSDPNPNKALREPAEVSSSPSCRFASHWVEIVQHGVILEWRAIPNPQVTPPPNHGSARGVLNALVKDIPKGQDEDRYLVLDIDLIAILDGVYCSPFGEVPKCDKPLSKDARIIHDLSFPAGRSVNDCTIPKDEIDIRYDGARAIVSRIQDVDHNFPGMACMMSGDVRGAFRHIPIHADHCCKFAGTIPELRVLVVDLCCPFGWRNSPASYAIARGAINHLYSSSQPSWPDQPTCGASPFDGKMWCNDHNCVNRT
ncbi:Cleavage induced protein [Phytophthora megakarya]|uniref:Cleavage induced protein n=1 Tax=Phytophthora megakarya TaxID=4795 RepID=A0A225WT59_9STRA|nr:Cleavage induced protein [Phytophthora megakarya]